MASRYTIGIDFGTEAARAVLLDVSDGVEIAIADSAYPHRVIVERLPLGDADRLPPDWALQDPEDYLNAVRETVPSLMRQAGVDPALVAGLGIDFTSCTMLPVRADGTPLCLLPEFRANPHAWVKLWKHHAAQPEADLINETARRLHQGWLSRYGGKYSSEWFFSKVLQILREAPEVYAAADRLIEASDWIVWQLTGRETRNPTSAGYKALWSKREGFPDPAFFAALDPRLATVIDEKMSRNIHRLGERAGGLSAVAAGWTSLRAGTPVAVANIDAHASVPGAGVTEPGTLVAIIGTSTCHMVLGREMRDVEGMCGVVEDGILPGLFGYEAGQSGVGDIFAWFVANAVPGEYRDAARQRGIDIHALLEAEAARQRPGESGVIALDWWNGNRSVLVDVELSGLVVGATLSTTAPEIYRALIEATAFGTRVICDAFERAGVAVNDIVACGGLPQKNRLFMQIYADVTGRHIRVGGSSQVPARGAAMFAAVAAGSAAGGYDRIEEAVPRMADAGQQRWEPVAAHQRVYDRLYDEYRQLHDHFGRGGSDVMKRLREIRREALAAGGPEATATRPAVAAGVPLETALPQSEGAG